MQVFAPAKVNLCLHITGQRPDGYHEIDSLVVFAGVGDWLTLTPGDLRLDITGPEARGLTGDDDNLVLRAARMMGVGAQITLEKTLPVASGIGGGSADAAAALRGLSAQSGRAIPTDVAALGADVPMCVASVPVRATGIGDALAPLPPLPPLWMVLVNPRNPVSTPDVFRALHRKNMPPVDMRPWTDAEDFADFLSDQRNDLEPAAIGICPSIADVLDAINETDPMMARMSGSGATCFGLFATPDAAAMAAAHLRVAQPTWWVADAPVLGPAPQFTRATT